jgi:hypothetical protein
VLLTLLACIELHPGTQVDVTLVPATPVDAQLSVLQAELGGCDTASRPRLIQMANAHPGHDAVAIQDTPVVLDLSQDSAHLATFHPAPGVICGLYLQLGPALDGAVEGHTAVAPVLTWDGDAEVYRLPGETTLTIDPDNAFHHVALHVDPASWTSGDDVVTDLED